MKKIRNSTPIVIDLVSGFELTPRPRAIKVPSVIDLTNLEPDVIVLDSIVNTPQTRSRKRKFPETLSRCSSVSDNSEVMVLSSNFPLKKKQKSAAVTPKVTPKTNVVSSKKKQKLAALTPKVTPKPNVVISKKKQKRAAVTPKTVQSSKKKKNSVGKRKSLLQSNKKVVAKSKRKLVDISNVASNHSKRPSIKSPAPLSKAASDYYSKITKAVNENTNNKSKKRKSKSLNKQERIIRTVTNNGVTRTSLEPIPSKKTFTVPQASASSTRLPPSERMVSNRLTQQPASNFCLPPKLPVPTQNLVFQEHRQLFLSRTFGQSATNYYPRAFHENSNVRRKRKYHGNLQSRLQQENFNNFYNPNPINVEEEGFRPIVIDGSNVACGHGRGTFSPKGLQICVDFFNKRGMDRVKVFLPQSKQQLIPEDIMGDLRGKCEVVFTPVSKVGGIVKICYDDRFIVQYANEVGGIIVSTDNYRDLVKENPSWKYVIETRLLMFSWVDDLIMFPKDPLGKDGPTLQEFLKF